VSLAATFVGWLTAAALATIWLCAHRALDTRMEAVARACHELRGPITAARLGLELGSRTGALSSAQLRAIGTELGRATLALEDLAGTPGGAIIPGSPESVDLGALLTDSVRAWEPSALAAGVQLSLLYSPDMPPAWGDRLRLAQATGNLIANAIGHGATRVLVRGSAGEMGARIEVIDDGPGLPAALRELVRRARHGRGRHGRGLAICHAVAAGHGGSLAALPVRRGTHLVIDLPTIGSAGCAPAPVAGR
jgi:signal transduction histidine kinase